MTVQGASQQIRNFKKDRGAAADADINSWFITADDGKSYNVEHYSATVITYVGFRAQATQYVIAFQDWVGRIVQDAIQAKMEVAPRPVSPLDVLDSMVQQLRAQDAEIRQLQAISADTAVKVQGIEVRLDNADYQTVRQFCKLQGIGCTASMAQAWGRGAAELSRANNVKIEVVLVDGKSWPSENKYHADILLAVCVPKPKVPFGQLPLPKRDN